MRKPAHHLKNFSAITLLPDIRALSSAWQNVPLATAFSRVAGKMLYLPFPGQKGKIGEGPGFKSLRVHYFSLFEVSISFKSFICLEAFS
jgi:hypothetical protein